MLNDNVNKLEVSPDSFQTEMNKSIKNYMIEEDNFVPDDASKVNYFKYDNKPYKNFFVDHDSLKESSYYTDDKTNIQTVLEDPSISRSLPASLKSQTLSLYPNQKNRYKHIDLNENDERRFPYTTFNYRLIIVCIAAVASIGPLSGNLYIPAIPTLKQKLNLSTEDMNGSISVFMAVFCVFPIFWGILSDRYGRKIILIFGICLGLISNSLLARLNQISTKNILGQLYGLRVIQAISASSFISAGCGIIRDLVPLKWRGTYMGYFFLGPNLAPVLAPILAGVIMSNFDNKNGISDLSYKGDRWRWLFLLLVIVNAIAALVVVIFIPETCRSLVGNGDPRWAVNMKQTSTLTAEEIKTVRRADTQILFGALKDPISKSKLFIDKYSPPPLITFQNFINIFKMKHIVLVSVCVSLQFSLYYAFVITLAHVLQNDYSFNNLTSAVSYVVPGAGLIIGNLTSGRISDRTLNKLREKHNLANAELRLVFLLLGIASSCISSLIYGWLVHFKVPSALVLISTFFIGIGLTWSTNSASTYCSHIAKNQTGAAISVMNSMRNGGAAISSAITYQLIKKMNIGWVFTGLSLLTTSISLILSYVVINAYKIEKKSVLKSHKVMFTENVSLKSPGLIKNILNMSRDFYFDLLEEPSANAIKEKELIKILKSKDAQDLGTDDMDDLSV
ncbi:uncharacterized protein HGUI_02220 [Hanseniaspora guilliermondii]|uniref:Major facilitator superfamily (MFS) profile domain-containing protein n=1 Tax=Hanseniaspora guilliermondii TaxID=56406 RepID=A0A1L0B2H6_9ASCO|nr:uncharacterized protein HGUI_02220 [Hanseniaspora guilliermondii]